MTPSRLFQSRDPIYLNSAIAIELAGKAAGNLVQSHQVNSMLYYCSSSQGFGIIISSIRIEYVKEITGPSTLWSKDFAARYKIEFY
jgi:hypothetical protein